MRIGKQSSFKDTNFEDKKKIRDYISFIDKDLRNIILVLQGRTRFGNGDDAEEGENISGQFQVVSDSGTADTEFTVAHGLGSVPIGYIVIKIDAGGVVYDSRTTWTSSNIYLKCSAANAAITLFLLK